MRHLKILVLSLGTLALGAGAVVAGMNPNDFGLAGGSAAYNTGKSRICIDCHTTVPGNNSAATRGTHFVVGSSADDTRTGGGWTGNSKNGERRDSAYFRLAQWPVGGTYSKYGGHNTDNNSYFTGATDNIIAGLARSDASLGNYTTREIICESCHNLVLNVAGGNNLVAPMTVATYTANTGDNTQVINWQNSDEATLCVGCHGFMYSAAGGPIGAPTAAIGARLADTRNNIDGGSVLRNNNHRHYIGGVAYNQNHHMMSADTFAVATASAGLYWADTLVKDIGTTSGWAAGAVLSTTPVANARGTMPMLAAWVNDGGKVKASAAGSLNCLHCHSAPHSGDTTMGASILRDTNAAGVNTFGTPAIARLGEGSTPRDWMNFNDTLYCNDCHTLASR
jgi:hypothetical protein